MPRHAVAMEPDLFKPRPKILAAAQARELAAELGITAARGVCKIRKEIAAAGTIYRMFLDIQDTKSPKHGREELDRLINALGEARAALDGLVVWSRLELDDTLRKMLGNDLSAANATAGLLSVRAAAKRVRAKLPSGGGRPNLDLLRWLCEQLADIYEKAAGQPYTYNAPAPGKDGLPEFGTAGARWIARVVRMVDPEVTQSNLVTILPYLRKPPSK